MRRTAPGAQSREKILTFLKNTRENFRFRKNKIFEFFIIIPEKVPGLGNDLGCNTQASGAPLPKKIMVFSCQINVLGCQKLVFAVRTCVGQLTSLPQARFFLNKVPSSVFPVWKAHCMPLSVPDPPSKDTCVLARGSQNGTWRRRRHLEGTRRRRVVTFWHVQFSVRMCLGT